MWRYMERHGVTEMRKHGRVVPHPRVVSKNREGYLGRKGSQPHARSPSPQSTARKISPHNFWL